MDQWIKPYAGQFRIFGTRVTSGSSAESYRLIPAGSLGLSTLALALLLTSTTTAEAQEEESAGNCFACHSELQDSRLLEPALAFAEDVHGAAGLPCSGCHGGDAAATDARIAHVGMLARPPRSRTPELCGRCHSNAEFMKRFNADIRVDQVDRYRTSVHGHRLLDAGDENAATCEDCHGAHGILPPSDERSTVYPLNIPGLCGRCHADPDYMAPYGIPTDQLAEYESSVHWRTVSEAGDLSAPTCNDCHGNHGAAPPGYTTIGRVCAECHFQIGQHYAVSPHDTAFARLGLPACVTCHENHAIVEASDEVLGLGADATCQAAGCHSADDAGGRAARVMHALIDSLRTEFEGADSLLLAAEHAGMPVSQAQFELNRARNALVEARAVVHTANLDSIVSKIAEGREIAAAGRSRAEAAFAELDLRRTGLAISSAVILVLIIGLVLKIRQVERNTG